ncbi:hypothetical protein Tco_0043984 [Tanacetum coccineum]
MSLTEAAEEKAARLVHATHERILTESDPKPARRKPSGVAFRETSSVSKKMSPDPSQKLKGVQTLTPEEQLAADTMQALKDSRKSTRSQPHARGSSEGTGTKPGVPDESTVILKTLSDGTGRRRPSGIAFRYTSSVSKKMSPDPSQKLKGVQTLTPEEQLAANTMQALKASRKSTRSQPHARGSSEGTGTKPGVPDESTVILKTLSDGTGRRRPSGIAFRYTSSVSKKMSPDPSQKLKGVQTLTPEEQLVADTMQALKASKKSSRSQSLTGGSSEGTGVASGVPDESTVIPATSCEGTGTKPKVLDEEKVTSEANVILDWGSEQESEYSE